MDDFTIAGFGEISEDLKKAIDYYPNKAEKTLEKEGRKFKKLAKENTNKLVRVRTGNLTSGYRVSKAIGYRENMEVNFMAENKGNAHFHLIEHGHDVYAGEKGKAVKVGYKSGYHMIQRTKDEYKERLPQSLEEMRDEILREAGLI
ncbi:hypothetical protein DWW96_10805 [Eubacterium sp. AF17-7]|uniref:HK97 gp10 family phage protein n=1 Tax=Eubacterium sp. AF17-7 TaxID=2293105 RepID=UPI000E5512A2|nr:HK97 gp10 family phage protein [Eubacterium sp. AF17-7]RGG63424.1 hypothetical protein DWW96_10805 [Eubacterium sp. AF17-7]